MTWDSPSTKSLPRRISNHQSYVFNYFGVELKLNLRDGALGNIFVLREKTVWFSILHILYFLETTRFFGCSGVIIDIDRSHPRVWGRLLSEYSAAGPITGIWGKAGNWSNSVTYIVRSLIQIFSNRKVIEDMTEGKAYEQGKADSLSQIVVIVFSSGLLLILCMSSNLRMVKVLSLVIFAFPLWSQKLCREILGTRSRRSRDMISKTLWMNESSMSLRILVHQTPILNRANSYVIEIARQFRRNHAIRGTGNAFYDAPITISKHDA